MEEEDGVTFPAAAVKEARYFDPATRKIPSMAEADLVDLFAAHALAGLLANPEWRKASLDMFADTAYAAAHKMLECR